MEGTLLFAFLVFVVPRYPGTQAPQEYTSMGEIFFIAYIIVNIEYYGGIVRYSLPSQT